MIGGQKVSKPSRCGRQLPILVRMSVKVPSAPPRFEVPVAQVAEVYEVPIVGPKNQIILDDRLSKSTAKFVADEKVKIIQESFRKDNARKELEFEKAQERLEKIQRLEEQRLIQQNQEKLKQEYYTWSIKNPEEASLRTKITEMEHRQSLEIESKRHLLSLELEEIRAKNYGMVIKRIRNILIGITLGGIAGYYV